MPTQLFSTSRDHYLQAMGVTRWQLRKPKQLPVNEPSGEPDADWSLLKQQVATCERCALCQGRTQAVFGVGNQQADLLIVGEAPGFHEDKQGEPFVGRAGQLLTAMLDSIGLSREQVYIANVLKCRPPNNRDPRPEEVTKCTPYLQQQVALLRPKMILAVGRYAAHYLLQTTTPLSRLRRQQHVFGDTGIPLIVSYHPAYLLRNPADKRRAYMDLLLLSESL